MFIFTSEVIRKRFKGFTDKELCQLQSPVFFLLEQLIEKKGGRSGEKLRFRTRTRSNNSNITSNLKKTQKKKTQKAEKEDAEEDEAEEGEAEEEEAEEEDAEEEDVEEEDAEGIQEDSSDE